MTAEEMRGADARAQRLGTPGEWLMEQAGTAAAAAAKALMVSTDRSLGVAGAHPLRSRATTAAMAWSRRDCWPQQGIALGGGAALRAAACPPRPTRPLNWDRLDGIDRVGRVCTARDSDVALYLNGIERAGLVIDALLGTGVSGRAA